MRVAVISDIHGNGPALEAVLADIDRRGVDAIYCLGDVCLQGPHPAECVDRLRERGIPTVRGNTDRYLARGGRVPNLSPAQSEALLDAWREALGKERLEWLGQLPERIEARWEGLPVLLVHGSPRSDEEPLLPFPTAGGTGGAGAAAAAPQGGRGGAGGEGPGADGPEDPLAGVTAALVLFGHHHLQLAWRQEGRWMVGPGSVGMPFDEDPRAAYALIEVHGEVPGAGARQEMAQAGPEAGAGPDAGARWGAGTPNGVPGFPGSRLEVTLVRVPYDLEATLAAHREGGWMAHNPLYPHQLRQARLRPPGA